MVKNVERVGLKFWVDGVSPVPHAYLAGMALGWDGQD